MSQRSFCLAVVVLVAGSAWSGAVARGAPATPSPMPPAATGAGDVEEIEEVEDVSEVKDVSQGSSGKKKRTLGQTLGRLHSALVHFPIAWLVLLLLLDIRTLAWGRPGWERLGLYVLVGTVVSFVPAMITGMLRADQLPRSKESLDLIVAHRNLAFAAGGALAAALAVRLAARNRLSGYWRWTYLGLLATATALVLLVGHRGGRLVFGTDFLPF